MGEELLPPRMFAVGDEPLGERVNSYHKVKRTELLIDALEPEELDFLRNSTFGKVLAIEENPPFSGAFGQYVVVRLLKVNKKYEVWFLFAGNPVKMSLREFAIITGLNCRKIPELTKKKKNPLKEKLYWNELMGSLKFCTIDIAIDMLKKKVHVEMIRDLDEFLEFPWGRASFHTLVTSLISKDEILVLLVAIPQLKKEITPSEPIVIEDSESEGESPEEHAPSEEENVVPQEKPSPATKYCLIPGHAKSIDTDCQVRVKCILNEPFEEWSAGLDFLWVDESYDLAVENMVHLIYEGFAFCKEMFKGGLTANDLARLRAEKKLKEKEPKEKSDKDHHAEAPDCEGSDSQTHILIANLVASQLGEKIRSPSSDIRGEISFLEKRIYQALDAKLEKIVASTIQSQQLAFIQTTISQSLQDIDNKVVDTLVCQLKIMEASLLKGLSQLSDTRVPSVNGSIPLAPDNIISAEAADFRISAVLRDLNTVPDRLTQESTYVVARRQSIEGKLPDGEDNHVSKPDTLRSSKAVELPAQKTVEQVGDISLIEEPPVATNMNTEHSEEPVEPNQNPEMEYDQSLGAQPMVVDEPVSQEVEIEEMHIPFYLLEMPSFSLGLSQEDAVVGKEMRNPISDASPPKEQELEVLEQRKSKRPRSRPVGLQDYKYDPKVTAGLCIIPDLDHRFKLMEETLLKESGINLLNDFSVTPTEFCDIGYHMTILPTGVMDALICFVSRGLASGSNV
ncbi:hypothetical protein Bca52824_065715 [Brassica carinata]|uniref:DUF1985 domain-containing protein n=2 Tax=Brassica TaxID=3705 RepID=A0A8X7QIX1_BRACI|nr:hypothetical protein Bca52824_065715 [Brassica carinata]